MTDTHCCLRHRRMSRLPLYALTRLTGFTLSHYGSHTSLPTLKPNLTIAAPRLCTDCLPGFVGTGVSPTYTAHTELAHPLRCPILRHGQKHYDDTMIFLRFQAACWPPIMALTGRVLRPCWPLKAAICRQKPADKRKNCQRPELQCKSGEIPARIFGERRRAPGQFSQ